MKHRYLQRIDVEVDTAYAGTDAEPLLVSSKDLGIAGDLGIAVPATRPFARFAQLACMHMAVTALHA